MTCVAGALTRDDLLGGEHTIGGSEYVTFREVVETIASALGKRRLMAPLPLPVARVQARVLTAMLSHPPLTPSTLELFSEDNATDIDATDRIFGFHPRGFREYIAEHGIEA